MPLAYCPIDCEDDAWAPRSQATPPAASAAGVDVFAGDALDTGPRPSGRGSWAGRAPDYLLADLRASAASGAGLSLMPVAAPGAGRGSLVVPLVVLSLFALALRSRSS